MSSATLANKMGVGWDHSLPLTWVYSLVIIPRPREGGRLALIQPILSGTPGYCLSQFMMGERLQ